MGGAAAVAETLRLGARIAGATAYFMTEDDTGCGPIISQRPVPVYPEDTPMSLSERIMRQAEWPVLTEAVGLYCAGALRVENGRVTVAVPENARTQSAEEA